MENVLLSDTLFTSSVKFFIKMLKIKLVLSVLQKHCELQSGSCMSCFCVLIIFILRRHDTDACPI